MWQHLRPRWLLFPLPARCRRLPEYDLVRVVAMVFVVAVHSLMVVDTSVRAGVITEVAGQSLFFTANALFFLLSGRFNLRDVPDGKLDDFYLKKFRGVILPALVIFFVRALYDLRVDPVSLRHVVGYFVRGSLGQYSGIEYWFIFSLAKLLLAAPSSLLRLPTYLPSVPRRSWALGLPGLRCSLSATTRALTSPGTSSSRALSFRSVLAPASRSFSLASVPGGCWRLWPRSRG